MEFGLPLWTKDDSGLPTRPLSIIKTLKIYFFDNVLLKHVGLIHVLPLAVYLFFCAEQLEGVLLSH